MNRNRCSSGKRPDGVAGRAARRAARIAIPPRHRFTPPPRRHRLALGLLALCAPWLLHAPAAAAELACPEDKELCVQAERSGGIDLKTGVAHLEGNVQGIVRSRALEFSGRSLTAFRNGGQEWVRLVLEEDVQLRQQGRESVSDHGVLERDEIRLNGNVRIEQEEMRIEGHEALITSEPARTVVHGEPGVPLTIRIDRALLAANGQAPPGTESGAAPVQTVTTELRALKAVVEETPKRLVLSGSVHIRQSDDRLRIDAQAVTLFFTPESALESFRAEGNVVIAQPDRRISADFAQSRNELQTILLVGHATMQQAGQFDLKSDRMEVFVDSSKGIMQSQDRQKPITLSLELGDAPTYGLTPQHVRTLSGQGIPAATLDKLAPVVGERYPSREELRKAVAARLTPAESRRHLDAILAVTR